MKIIDDILHEKKLNLDCLSINSNIWKITKRPIVTFFWIHGNYL